MSTPPAVSGPRDMRSEVPASPIRVLLLVGLAFSAGLAAAWGLSRRDGSTFEGRIEARTTFVNADRPGVVTELLAQEGARVTLGDPLVTLADGELQTLIARAHEEVATLTSERDQALAVAAVELAWRIKEIDADVVEVQLRSADYLKQKYDYELERSMWVDMLSSTETVMFDNGSESFQSMVLSSRIPSEQRMNAMLRHETACNAVDVSSVQVEICEERLVELAKLKDQLPERVREKSGVNVAEERLAAAQAELARLESQQSELTVVSNAVGTVGVYRRKVGDHLNAGDPIVELLDAARRWLVVAVPSSQITEFTVGRELDLMFPGKQERQGTVLSVAPQAEPHDIVASAGGDATVIVRVEQRGKVWPDVPLGSRVSVQLAE
jgi:multidrug resistance efflux pump